MKKFVFAILSVLFAAQAFAAESSQVTGKDAETLLKILTQAGAQIDCGMGMCGTSASEIQCSRTKYTGKADCGLNVQDETGGQSAGKTLNNSRSLKLTNILIEAGTVGCGMDTCFGVTKEISCTFSNPNRGKASNPTECTVSN